MDDQDKLIEDARRAYLDAWAETTLEDVPPGTRSRNGIIAALAVFEKAHAPTDDEREAERIAYLDARQIAMRKDREDWYADYDAEPGIAGNAFERGWGAAVGARFARRPVSPEPQGEPSDAQAPECGGGRTNCRHDQWPPMHSMACPISKAKAAVTEQGGSDG